MGAIRLFVFCYSLDTLFASNSQCDNKKIVIKGLISATAEPLFPTVPDKYSTIRKNDGRNVIINTKVTSPSGLRYGINIPNSNDSISFCALTSPTLLYANEIRFPFVGSFTFVPLSNECDNRLIEVPGLLSYVAGPMFPSIPNLYRNERKRFGRDVLLIVPQVANTELKPGLYRPPYQGKSAVFIVGTSTTILNSNELRFPMAGSAVVLIFNVPGFTSLNVSLLNIIGMYKSNGSYYWNGPYIARLNPGSVLPDHPVRPIARMDNDGSTGLFTQVLSANNAEWKEKYGTIYDPTFVNGTCCNSTKWPKDSIYLYGNMVVGQVGLVASIPYTIGYATLPSLTQYTVNQVSLLTKFGGSFITPTVYSVQQAMQFYFDNSGPDELLLKLESANDSDAYPLSAFTYFVFNRSYTGVDCCVIEELVGFLDWFLFSWSDSELINLNFVPLLPALKERIKRLVIEKVTCEGELMYPRYLASKIIVVPMVVESWQIAIISAAVCVFITGVGCFIFYRYQRKHQSDESRWMIDSKRIKIIEMKKQTSHNGKQTDIVSVHTVSDTENKIGLECNRSLANGSISSSYHNRGTAALLKNQMIIGELDQNKIALDKLNCRFPQSWNKSTKRLMTRMKNLTNKNVLTLFGVTVLNNESYVILDHCAKGTLHYVLRTTRYQITDDIKYQFAIDVSHGMKYLHQSGIVHGSLNSLTCYLDSSWNVKVSQWEQMSLYLIENPKVVFDLVNYNENMYLEEEDLVKFLYVDPQIRRTFNESVDVYSFGLLIVEIFTRKLPYMKEIEDGSASYGDLLMKKFYRNYNMCPRLEKIPKRITSLSTACMSIENHRPSFQKIYSELKGSTKISTGIVDIIMDTLEQHAEKLEEKVEERTAELKQVTNRMRVLLHEVLPPQIAEKLFNGEPVPPEYYECVTIYFSDIVGFTTISARSTPIEVMTLLNDLWLAFDSVIDKFNVYKVDTIGDAYMVCSGLPIRNGMAHCREIALLSLALLERCNRFKIKHLPNETLKIRIGLNSGPVTAGVVGSKMPQYCVFGDAVNTANRMESTSEEQRIQISDCTHQYITDNYPNVFRMEYRGEIPVKGKGSMKTYWMLGTFS